MNVVTNVRYRIWLECDSCEELVDASSAYVGAQCMANLNPEGKTVPCQGILVLEERE